MSTIRISKDRNYSVINNTVLNDKRLTWKAKGLAAYLLSKPDDWQIDRDRLADQSEDGVTAVRSALKELEDCGYLRRTRRRSDNGKFPWEHTLFEIPQQPLAENPPVGKPSAENPPVEKPPVDNAPSIINTDVVNTDLPNTDLVEDLGRVSVAPPVDPTAPAPAKPPSPAIVSEIPKPPTAADLAEGVKTDSPGVDVGKAPPGRLVKPGTGLDAYWILREFTTRGMTSHQIRTIRDTVTDLTRWRRVCARWAEVYGDDWRKFGHLDWYRGTIPGEVTADAVQPPSTNGRGQTKADRSMAAVDRVFARLREQGAIDDQ